MKRCGSQRIDERADRESVFCEGCIGFATFLEEEAGFGGGRGWVDGFACEGAEFVVAAT